MRSTVEGTVPISHKSSDLSVDFTIKLDKAIKKSARILFLKVSKDRLSRSCEN